MQLSPIKRKILDYIEHETSKNAIPPSIREICAAVGSKSTSTVFTHLKDLENMGYIDITKGKKRSIRLGTHTNEVDVGLVPLLGVITAGEPILATEHIEGYVPFDENKLSLSDCFALRIRGNSMIGAGMFNGDLVIVRKQDTADNGDIVVALIEDEATVKRFFKTEKEIELRPENHAFQPIILNNVVILGKVCALIRYM